MSKKPKSKFSRLGVERLRKKLKQKQVADDLGITKQQLNAIEKSRRTVSPELALKIANYYSKPVEEFFLPTRFETRSLKNE